MADIKVTEVNLSQENGIEPTEKRFSKVNGQVCKLKMKIFSSCGEVREIEYSSANDIAPVTSVTLDDSVSTAVPTNEPTERTYSVASIKERLRESKFSPRQKFRRLCIDNKKFYAMVKNKITQDDFKLLKGLLASDVMAILNVVMPDIIKGKQINTLLGLSSLGKSLREAGAKLQQPMRLGITEEKRTGAVTKKRYQDLAKVYNEFIQSVFDYCYGQDQQAGALEVAEMTNASTNPTRTLENIKV